MKYPLSSILQEERKDMTIRECYEKTGLITKAFLKRFGSEAMIHEICTEVFKGRQFFDLKDALKQKMEKELPCSYTLKGVCINLGFDRLYNVSAELTEKLRGREIEESEELFEQVEKEYHALTAVLKQYERT